MKLALIPIDNRPVCYNLVNDIANIDSDLEIILPDKKLLGSLYSNADTDGIIQWLEKLDEVDAIVVSLDTIAYGGLISSRRCKDSVEEIKSRLQKVKKILKKGKKVYAFSSIMRISNNNVNEEEKEYWNKYGTQIFEYSYKFHKEGNDFSDVPKEILNDYLATRYRNFQINKMYIEWLQEGLFDTLVFSKDDCAQYGLNVMEADILEHTIQSKNLSGMVKTGADEIPLTLFARAIVNHALKQGIKATCLSENIDNIKAPKISVKFLAPLHKHLISNYEDISIEKSVKAQIELAGAVVAEEKEADLVLIVNNFEEQQGEIVMGVKTLPFSGQFSLPKKPYIIADVRFANGADNIFIDKLFNKSIDFDNFYGYSGWNTSANTLGSLICVGLVRHFAQNYNEEAFRKLQMVRFLDDWAYQANIRQALNGKREAVNGKRKEPRADFRKLTKMMMPFEKRLQKILRISPEIKYKFPWKRFFEIGITIK